MRTIYNNRRRLKEQMCEFGAAVTGVVGDEKLLTIWMRVRREDFLFTIQRIWRKI